MASPSDKNNPPQSEEKDSDSQPPQPSTSGTQAAGAAPHGRARPRLSPVRRRRQQQQPTATSRGPARPVEGMTVPTVTSIVRRAMRLAQQYLQHLARYLANKPPGMRVLVFADKAISCAVQALRWAGATPDADAAPTCAITEDIEAPGRPFGLSLINAVPTIMVFVRSAANMARTILNYRLPQNQDLICRLERYRRDLQRLQMYTVQQRRPSRPQRSTAAPGRRSLPAQASRVVAPAKSSSSSSSSEHTESGSEEVTRRYYSPPRFAGQREGGEKKEKPIEEVNREDSETQGRAAATAEPADPAAMYFGQQPPQRPSPSHIFAAEGTSPQAETARAPKRPAKISKNLFINLFGLKLA